MQMIKEDLKCLGFNVDGWPTANNMMVPKYLWAFLPASAQQQIKDKPPVVTHGKAGKAFSRSPRCFSGDDAQREYDDIQGF